MVTAAQEIRNLLKTKSWVGENLAYAFILWIQQEIDETFDRTDFNLLTSSNGDKDEALDKVQTVDIPDHPSSAEEIVAAFRLAVNASPGALVAAVEKALRERDMIE